MSYKNPFTLQEKRILVTGASSGIGRSIAQECAAAGATVVLNGRDEQRLNETLSSLEGSGHCAIAADLTHFDTVKQHLATLEPLDGLVLCAGVGQTAPVQNVKADKIQGVFSTNTFAPVQLLQMLVKGKKINRKASVVFISSIARQKPYVGNGVYSASKAALNGFSKVAALELAGREIRVNCIEPGLIMTSIVKELVFDEEQLAEFKKTMPLGFGAPRHIALGCVYLLSDASCWTTGTSLVIDGGQTLI